MEVEGHSNHKRHFKQLDIGDAFVFEDKVYMKVEYIENSGRRVNAVRSNGDLYYIFLETKVTYYPKARWVMA